MIDVDVLGDLMGAPIASVERGPIGNGQEIWFVELVEGAQVVVRRTAPGGPLDWTDRDHEYRVLEALAGVDIPTPVPLWLESDGGRLGRAAFAMTRLQGRPVRREPQHINDRIAANLGTTLARLHAARIEVDANHASAAAATRAQLNLWQAQYEECRRRSFPLMGALLAWLAARVPDSDRPATLLWADAGPHNILHDDGEITGLLDWELSHHGDPLEDLGGAVWAIETIAGPEVTIAAYETESGADVDREALAWFATFVAVNRGIMLIRGIGHYLDGTSRSQNHAALGQQLVRDTMSRAAATAGWPPAPPPAQTPPPRSEPPNRPRPDVVESLHGVATYLSEDVLPIADSAVMRRNLKTAVALLQTAALRHQVEDAVTADQDDATATLLESLRTQGVDTSGGLEATAVRVESEPHLARHRDAMRAHLLADVAREEGMLLPLLRLYGKA